MTVVSQHLPVRAIINHLPSDCSGSIKTSACCAALFERLENSFRWCGEQSLHTQSRIRVDDGVKDCLCRFQRKRPRVKGLQGCLVRGAKPRAKKKAVKC